MAHPGIDPTAAVPEADLLDQHAPAVPGQVDAAADLADPDRAPEADPADILEQRTELPEDEDGYANARHDQSWEVWPDV